MAQCCLDVHTVQHWAMRTQCRPGPCAHSADLGHACIMHRAEPLIHHGFWINTIIQFICCVKIPCIDWLMHMMLPQVNTIYTIYTMMLVL